MAYPDITASKNQERAAKHPLLWLLELILQHRFVAVYVILGIILHQSLRFVIPVLIGDLVQFGIIEGSIDQIKFYAILVIVVGVISAFFDMTMSWGNEYLASSVERDVRSIYFQTIQEKSLSYHEDSKIGYLMAIAQNDMRSLYSALSPGIRIFGEAFVSMATIAIIIFLESWMLGVLFVVLLPIWYISLKLYNQRLTPVAVSQQDQFRNLSANVQENLTGATVVRAFSQQDYEIEKFHLENEAYTKTWEKRGKVTALYFPMLIAYSIGGIIFLGAVYLTINTEVIIAGRSFATNFDLGGLVTIIGIVTRFRGPTFLLGRVLEYASLGLAGVRKIQGILAKDDTLPDADVPTENNISGLVEYNHVSFGYNHENILEDISFSAKPGDIVAIVGSTGSGKTTLLKLLTRLYDVSDGSIKIDGIDVRDYDKSSLRKSIAVVEQDVFLFSSSIIDNITYAIDEGNYTDDDIDRVIKVSRVNEFIFDLPEGLETVVGERGVRLSGGQKQRIAIARAFLVDPKILILDDSTSAVDAQTEQEIVSAIKDLMAGRTSFIITTRLNMIRQADTVLVLDKGALVAQGNHDELIRDNEIYRRIFDPHMELPTSEVRQ